MYVLPGNHHDAADGSAHLGNDGCGAKAVVSHSPRQPESSSQRFGLNGEHFYVRRLFLRNGKQFWVV